MTRNKIVEAKRRLYHLILELPNDQWTDDDRRIGTALMVDSEIQAILDKALKSGDGE